MRIIRVLNTFVAALLVLAGLLVLPRSTSAVSEVAQQPDRAVQPTSGVPGTTFAFFATGLSSNARYAYWATSPNGTVFGNDDYRTRTFGDRADWSWTSPGDAQPGTWVMVIQRVPNDDDTDEEKDRKEQDRKEIQFVITGPGGAPPPSQPAPGQPAPGEQAVEPGVGPAGTEFAFFATGFESNERVGFWVNAPDGSVLSDGDWAVDANSNGRADWRWESDDNLAAGFYTMVARGADSNVERVIPFEIR